MQAVRSPSNRGLRAYWSLSVTRSRESHRSSQANPCALGRVMQLKKDSNVACSLWVIRAGLESPGKLHHRLCIGVSLSPIDQSTYNKSMANRITIDDWFAKLRQKRKLYICVYYQCTYSVHHLYSYLHQSPIYIIQDCNLHSDSKKTFYLGPLRTIVLPKDLKNLVRYTVQFIKKNLNIIFTKADKDNITVALNKINYMSEIFEMLDNTETYVKITKNLINLSPEKQKKYYPIGKRRDLLLTRLTNNCFAWMASFLEFMVFRRYMNQIVLFGL